MFDLSKCDFCGDCLVRCQYVDYSRAKAIQEMTVLTEGKDAEILRECTTCMACNEYCQKGANPYDLILQLQEEKGILPAPESSMEMLAGEGSGPGQVTWGDPDKPVISFCQVKKFFPDGVFQGQMFDGLTVIEGGEYFCYIAYLHTARESLVRKGVPRFVDNLASLNVKEVVLTHDDCYTALTTKAREYGIEVPFRPVHIIEYLLHYLKEHHNRITNLNKKIAYQRPCISRYTPEKEPMLDELFELIGVQRVARKYDRQDALCCGSIFIEMEPERGLRVQDMNITDAIGYGADAMVMLCPVCWTRLSQPCQERGLPPILLTDLCRVALGEKPFPPSAA